MAIREHNFAVYVVPALRLGAVPVLFAFIALSQQIPFIPVSGPNAPKGASWILEDRIRGGLWLGGMVEGSEGLTYFDGSRFVSPLRSPFPKVTVTGAMVEDTEGGIWLATNAGLYRTFQGRLDLVTKGAADRGIAQAAPDIFLATVTRPGTSNAELLRVAKTQGAWKSETIIQSTPQVSLQPDHDGNVLYECPGGYCEIRGADVAKWRMGAMLTVERHLASRPAVGSDSFVGVWRDRFGCVWLSSTVDLKYHCPGETQSAAPNNESIAGPGSAFVSELEDGFMVLPSFGRLVIGRPGHFRIITASHGYPGTINTVVTRDGSLWLSNGNGLFVFPSRQHTEFWTEREGLDGNAWSILRTPSKTLAVAGEGLRVLDQDRSRWSLLPVGQPVSRLFVAFDGMILASRLTGGALQISGDGTVIRKAELSDAAIQQADAQADLKGNLWTCSNDLLIHKTSSGWKPISARAGQGCSYNNLSFAIDHRGDIWYAKYQPDGGVTFDLMENPDGLHPHVRHFSSGGEVGNATVRFLGVDSRGWIWRGSPIGIYVADPEQARQGQWLYLNRQDGIAGTDANRRSFFSDSDGSVWFGLDNSINHFYPPADFLHPHSSPAVFISGYSVNGGEFQMADMVGTLDHNSDIIAHIGSLQFDRRNALRLRYRLLPTQTSWTTERNLDIPLGKLPWGTHTLEIQARLFTGPWSSTVTKSFTVLKPFWLTWPALLAFAALTSSATAGALASRKKRRRRAATELPGLADWRLTVLTPEMGGLEGTTLDGQFALSRILARGGFATVFEGRDLHTQQPCALKIFRHELTEKSWMARRFQQEVSALQQIHHPNVVGIYGHGNAPNGAPYLAMELIAGKTLRDLLNETQLTRAQIASYLRQTGSALAEIHARQICHRDLKPENLMIRHPAVPGADLVLIDFSIAIVQDPDETLHGLSRAAGTLQYMAPEQAIGYADASSDIYSLAKILLEMLTGQRLSVLLPDASLDLPARIREMLTATPHGLSVASIDLIAQSLEFDPSRRPKNAADFTIRISQDLESAGRP
jgi:tRNA A-37 threonylcarbamoyl transferase component Bud32